MKNDLLITNAPQALVNGITKFFQILGLFREEDGVH